MIGRPKEVIEYEIAMAEALRVKVEEDMLEAFFPGDEPTKEKYREHGMGRKPLMNKERHMPLTEKQR